MYLYIIHYQTFESPSNLSARICVFPAAGLGGTLSDLRARTQAIADYSKLGTMTMTVVTVSLVRTFRANMYQF